ncbi:hypothetical protein B0H14DRAFT_2620857 [Mycena olivaceomarginata]|nr:hypothetical protein B0H14DRAFT_2620857 [Mycena olivaceomarginata]
MCWEKSFIPKSIWQVGDNTSNILESVHADANREGISCTLVGGVKKGLHLDSLKMKTLGNWERTGIRPRYTRGHISESAERSLKRKCYAPLHDLKMKAEEQLYTLRGRAGSQAQLERAQKAVERASDGFEKALVASREVVGSGSGKVGLLLPFSGVSGSSQFV